MKKTHATSCAALPKLKLPVKIHLCGLARGGEWGLLKFGLFGNSYRFSKWLKRVSTTPHHSLGFAAHPESPGAGVSR